MITNFLVQRGRIICSAVLILLFLVNISYLFFDKSNYLLFLETNFSIDGNISKPLLHLIGVQVFFIIAILAVWVGSSKRLYENFQRIDIVTGITILLLFTLYHLRYIFHPLHALYAEDSFFETMTAVFFLISAILVFFSINNYESRPRKVLYMAIALLLFFMGMEEISWGQRIFGWQTPAFWKSINFQKETNIHNLFNPFLKELYPAFNLLSAILLISYKKIRTTIQKRSNALNRINSSLLNAPLFYAFVFVLLAFQSAILGGELTEEVVSVMALSFTVRGVFSKRMKSNCRDLPESEVRQKKY